MLTKTTISLTILAVFTPTSAFAVPTEPTPPEGEAAPANDPFDLSVALGAVAVDGIGVSADVTLGATGRLPVRRGPDRAVSLIARQDVGFYLNYLVFSGRTVGGLELGHRLQLAGGIVYGVPFFLSPVDRAYLTPAMEAAYRAELGGFMVPVRVHATAPGPNGSSKYGANIGIEF